MRYFGLAFVFAFILVSSFAFAATDESVFFESKYDFGSEVTTVLNDVAATLEPIFSYTLGDSRGSLSADLLFIKILVFFAMLAILYYAVLQVPGISDNKFVVWVLALVISILSTRFMTNEALINLVWLPNGVLGLTLASFIPFVIFFFFIESFPSQTIRRGGWSLFALMFIGLAITRWDLLESSSGAFRFNLAWIYIVAALLAFVSAWLDGTIRAWYLFSAIEKKGEQIRDLEVAKVQEQIQDARKVISSSSSTPDQVKSAHKTIDDAHKRIKTLLKS
ncbi:MAG: hypothetical protein AABW79_00965 [Nanoarchaeota archaeon]